MAAPGLDPPVGPWILRGRFPSQHRPEASGGSQQACWPQVPSLEVPWSPEASLGRCESSGHHGGDTEDVLTPPSCALKVVRMVGLCTYVLPQFF